MKRVTQLIQMDPKWKRRELVRLLPYTSFNFTLASLHIYPAHPSGKYTISVLDDDICLFRNLASNDTYNHVGGVTEDEEAHVINWLMQDI